MAQIEHVACILSTDLILDFLSGIVQLHSSVIYMVSTLKPDCFLYTPGPGAVICICKRALASCRASYCTDNAPLCRFTPGMYAPGLGFLMFAVGINLRPEAFKKVFMSPKVMVISQHL